MDERWNLKGHSKLKGPHLTGFLVPDSSDDEGAYAPPGFMSPSYAAATGFGSPASVGFVPPNATDICHVALIPDGNRRWASDKKLSTSAGHSTGSKRILKNCLLAFNLGIYCVSVWGSSYENLTKRSTLEIKSLFKVYKKGFESLINNPELHEKKIRVMIIGRWREVLDKSVIETADKLMDITKKYDGHSLNFYIGYSGTDEMIYAIKEIVEESKKDEKIEITENVLEKYLWSGSLPPVDLIIRTGVDKDPHNSAGFMMWKTANSQYYFTKIKCPDFTENEFMEAIKSYQNRERRMGR